MRLEAPGGPTDYYYGTTRRPQTLLADRDSDRIWSVPRPDGLPDTPDRGGESAPFVIAQDVTGRRWTLSLTDQGLSVWWSDDGGGAWTQASLAMHSDHFLYTDRTIGFTVGTSLTLSTDRGATWRTHRLPDRPRSASLADRASPARAST